MRMLEDILLNEDGPYCETTAVRQFLPEMQIFLIDNVSEYLYAQTDQEVWDVKTDFPCLAPPFPSIWMEHGRPSKIVSCEHGSMSSELLPYRTGMFFNYSEINAENFANPGELQKVMESTQKQLERGMTPRVIAELDALKAAGANFYDVDDPKLKQASVEAKMMRTRLMEYAAYDRLKKEGVGPTLEEFTRKGIVWLGKCLTYIQHRRHGPVIGPLGEQTLMLNANGDVVEQTNKINLHILKNENDWFDKGGGLSTVWFPGLLAISFTHCKNIVITPEEKPDAKFLKRQAERGRSRLTYKVLEIGPIKTILKRAGAENPQTGLRHALHICRGHFAHYEDKGLFGKYKGRFWIPQHIRGTKEAGVVVKEYSVNPPRQARFK